ncbi:GNAT family N-acetyltransferase [Dongia sp.]|uniref:GNAT family N-acetyltransferase n=1 Tax=Dongia sp. TaxID=1977262 RepID=UPI0037518B7C
MDISFRIGEAADAELIVDMVLQAGDGLFESLLDGVVPGVRAKQLLRMAVKGEGSPLNFGNAIVAEGNGAVVGMALSYPASEFGLHPVLQSLLPRARIEQFEALFQTPLPDSWYLNSLAVADAFRGKGLAKLLLGCCGDLALSAGQSRLSLHVWADNQVALELYRKLGFDETQRIPVRLGGNSRPDSEMVLMTAPLPLA